MTYVLGIDGGGTKTAAVILTAEGQQAGCGEGGPSTYGIVPEAVFRESITTAVSAAWRSAGLAPTGFAAAFLGLGNVVSELDRRAVQAIAAQILPAPFEMIGVDHDIRVALAGGLCGRPGIVLIAGTGTSCFGRNAIGDSWRSGGWGPLIDDEGSSYWLGIQAMRAAVQDFDGRGQPTRLRAAVADRFQLHDLNELMNRLYASGISRTEIAALAPLVFEAARQGDAAAAAMIRAGCQAMAECVLAVARRLGLDQGLAELAAPVELAVVGGMTKAGADFFDPLAEAVRARLPQCQIQPAELSPVIGAGLLALQMSGQALDEAVLAEVKSNR